MRGLSAGLQLVLIAVQDSVIAGLCPEWSALNDDSGAGLGEGLLREDNQGTAGAVSCPAETEPGG
jgi:hypothetical protein